MFTKLIWNGALFLIFFAEIKTILISKTFDICDHGGFYGLLTHFAR